MRPFPRTARRRLIVAGAATTLVIGVVSGPLASADDLKQKQRRVQNQIEQGEHALEHSSSRLRQAYTRLNAARAELDRARNQLDRTRVRLDAARERDREMRQKLAQARARLAQAEADLVRGREDVEDQRESVTDLVTTIYQEGDPQLQALTSVLSANSAEDLTWTQEGQSVMLGRETRAYDQLRAAEVLLQVREEQRRAAEAEVEERRQAAADHLVLMRELTAQARQARARVRETVQERRSATAQAARARARDQAQLSRLEREEDRIKRLIAAQAAKNRAPAYRSGGDGFLGFPMQGGYVTSSFGMRTHPIYGYRAMHNGTDFGGGCGRPLLAAASGRVMARYYSSVFGNRLFVYVGKVNGNNLSIVYNHASGYRVGVGSSVSRGQVVGYSGNTGWSTACHLHFTVLLNGQPVDPMNWL